VNVIMADQETTKEIRMDEFHCSICWQGFKNVDTLKAHQVSLHQTSTAVVCLACRREFAEISDLNQHRRTCIWRPF
jgi:DNA-directed RNA polymerase subunit RPC12/RpoP